MKALLLAPLLFLMACTPNNARLKVDNPIKENSEAEAGPTPTESISGSWYYLLTDPSDPRPRGYAYTVDSSGSFERFTFIPVEWEGQWTTKVTKANGTYNFDGNRVVFSYVSPSCLNKHTEEFDFESISTDGHTLKLASGGDIYSFKSGDIVTTLKNQEASSPCPRISLLDEKSKRMPASKVKK